MNSDLVSYYKERAKEYEKIYSKPERQHDLLAADKVLQEIFTGKEVLEIACGTGYWTERIALTAKSILATDINDAVISIAESKSYPAGNVKFRRTDIFNMPGDTGKKESLFGGFIWSHIPIQELSTFIGIAGRLVKEGGIIVFMDNNFVSGSNLPVIDKDESGNTYQERILENSTKHKVLKNFPSEDFIRRLLEGKAKNIRFIHLQYYWIVQYENLG